MNYFLINQKIIDENDSDLSQLKPEAAAFARFAFDMKLASVLFEQFAANDQTQSATLFAGGSAAGL